MIKMLFAIISLFFCIDLIRAQSLCGDWVAYRDINCYNIFENSGLQTYEDAINTCRQQSNDSHLVTINNLEEQSFLTTFIFSTKNIVDNVWIGAKYVNSHYEWLNGVNLTFTNWAEGYPKNLTDNCIELHSDPDFVGKWYDASCKRKNLVVCEKPPNWSIAHIQETMIGFQETQKSLQEMNKYLTEKVSILEKNESDLREAFLHLQSDNNILKQNEENLQKTIKQNELNFQDSVTKLKESIIPVGFIYVQFPGEKTPQEIWSWMTWQEITSSYAGLFFRAFGGNSSSFGSTQEGNAPRITQIQSDPLTQHTSESHVLLSDIKEGEWSKWIITGKNEAPVIDTRFYASSGEVRPRNTAIHIWKRNA